MESLVKIAAQTRTPRLRHNDPPSSPPSFYSATAICQTPAGIVAELGTLIAGPFAARIPAAEFGAEVTKIEAPDGGDQGQRKWRKLYRGHPLWWYRRRANKRSVTVNPGTRTASRWCATGAEADIVVENFRPACSTSWAGLGGAVGDQPWPAGVAPVGLRPERGRLCGAAGFGAIGESMGGCAT